MTDYQDSTKYLQALLPKDSSILEKYSGIFGQDVIKKYATKLDRLTSRYLVTQRRIFYVFVELAQNVGFYSQEKKINNGKEVGIGDLVIYETANTIGFIIGNVINTSALKVLRRKWKIINSLDRVSLREFKRHQRNLIPGTNGGAHIGLIMVALTTRKNLDTNIIELKEGKSFFSINVEIEKIKENL